LRRRSSRSSDPRRRGHWRGSPTTPNRERDRQGRGFPLAPNGRVWPPGRAVSITLRSMLRAHPATGEQLVVSCCQCGCTRITIRSNNGHLDVPKCQLCDCPGWHEVSDAAALCDLGRGRRPTMAISN
jgi:hypothetical protein